MKVPRELFIPLTEEEEAEVYRAFSGRNRYGFLRCSIMLSFFFCESNHNQMSPFFQKEGLGYS